MDKSSRNPIYFIGGPHDGSRIKYPPTRMQEGMPVWLPRHAGHICLFITPHSTRDMYIKRDESSYILASLASALEAKS